MGHPAAAAPRGRPTGTGGGASVSAGDVARDVAAVVTAAGALAFLAPVPARARPLGVAGAGLALLALGWLLLAGSLVPSGDASRAAHRLVGPLGVVALGALLVAAVVLLAGARVLARRPWLVFALLVVAIPVRLPVTLGSQSAILQVPLYCAMALVLAATVAGGRVRRVLGDGAGGPLDLPVAAFTAWAAISLLWTADGEAGAVKAVFFLLPFVVLYRLVVAWWPGAHPLRTLGVGLVAVAVPIAALALVQYVTGWIFWNSKLQEYRVYGSFFRVNGIFYDPNVLGRFLVFALLALLGLACASTAAPRRLAVLGACVPVLALALVVTFSQSSALALMVGIAVLATWLFGERLVAGLLIGVLALAVGTTFATSSSVRDGLTSRSGLDRITEGRFDLMRGGVEIWREDPVVGSGLGSFQARYRQTLTPEELRTTRVTVSHNAPLTVLSELGIVGVLPLAALVVVPARALLLRARAGDGAGLAALVVLAMLAAVFVHSLLYAALFEDPVTWVLGGAATVLLTTAPGRAPALPRHRSSRRELTGAPA